MLNHTAVTTTEAEVLNGLLLDRLVHRDDMGCTQLIRTEVRTSSVA